MAVFSKDVGTLEVGEVTVFGQIAAIEPVFDPTGPTYALRSIDGRVAYVPVGTMVDVITGPEAEEFRDGRNVDDFGKSLG
jgi:hypothetical protein